MKEIRCTPERLDRWLTGFAERHGETSYAATPQIVTVTAADGARAECRVPFPPLAVDETQQYAGLVEHARRDRTVGVVLVRMGGYAAGVFEGRHLVASKVGSRLVQGRSAAGGWSQQRFARRREKQAREAFGAAADVVARVVVPRAEAGELDAVVVGGDKRAVEQVLADTRLGALHRLVAPPHLHVPDPRLAVLRRTPEEFRAVHIRLSAAAWG
ncbi:acVLRF1 family peptidyl-tRNA hydrolase [Actinopolymorpha sp. B11F2]|uniref:acVLRF1 family peptidyl-tRNA hydrolase n=1 Tax=Actinopolymorpha sp. B11F2 TaxID=3160862 RepID=UPI0032E4F45B